MSGYFDGTADVYRETRRVARKKHTCSACEEVIPPKCIYYSIANIYDGHVSSFKRCEGCQRMHVHLRDLVDDWPAECLDCGHDYVEMHGEPPLEIAALAFMRPCDFPEENV